MLGYCTRDQFLAHLKNEERAANAGALTQYDSLVDHTLWKVAGRVVGVSGGRVGASSWYRLA